MIDFRAHKDSRKGLDQPAFVDLPNGIFTPEGVWFHTRVQDLEAFAGPVLAKVSLKQLLRDAGGWSRSPVAVSLWAMLAALMFKSLAVALAAGLTAFVGWTLLSPGIVLRPLVAVHRISGHPMVLGVAYVLGLSLLSSSGAISSVVVGLVWFVVLRWGVLDRLLSPALEPVRARMYALQPPDQILRSLIIRHALAHRLSIGDLDEMERRILEIANRHRKKKNP
ncbi:MAG: hypothetical protein ACI9W4_002014 [Rhodothermales bacterium]